MSIILLLQDYKKIVQHGLLADILPMDTNEVFAITPDQMNTMSEVGPSAAEPRW